MVSKHHHPETDMASLLESRRDRVYLCSLLIPLLVYDLALKSLLISGLPSERGQSSGPDLMRIRLPGPATVPFVEVLGLVQSDLLFILGYILLCIGLFTMARTGMSRRIVVGLLHGLTLGIALLTTIAYRYYRVTGSTLDYGTFRRGITALADLRGLIASEASAGILVLTLAVLLYALLGPSWIASLVDRWRAAPVSGDVASIRRSRRSWPALGLGAAVFLAGSILPGIGTTGVSRAFAQDAVVHVMLTAVEMAPGAEARKSGTTALPAERLPGAARLLPVGTAQRRNIVLIVLESTRADATTPYNRMLHTTPFMDELARRSLLADNAYAIIPHTHQALTALNCGIAPPLTLFGNRVLQIPNALPPICLPHLLRARGYNTVFFKSTVKSFENSKQIIQNLGYTDIFTLDDMDTEGFEKTNYFGYEDEIMLEPSRAWHAAHLGQPFLAAYLTSAPHHDYLAPRQRHGRVAFTSNDLVNRYLNSVRNQDFFLKSLFDQYRRLGLYDDTVFIVVGDHGQAFGEHGRYGHDNTIYDEGLRIPLLIHDPRRFASRARLEDPVSQLDILPTVADLLGYQLDGGPYGGSSLLRQLPDGRALRFSCLGDQACVASLNGKEKYIYHFDDRPEELFDLSSDPGERINLAGERAPAELDRRRAELLAWRVSVQAMYVARCTLVQGVACAP